MHNNNKKYAAAIADIILRRKYHDIPDWLIKQIDLDVYKKLDGMGDLFHFASMRAAKGLRPPEDFFDCVDVLERMRDHNTFRVSKLFSTQWFQGKLSLDERGILYRMAFLLQTNREWKKFLKLLYKKINETPELYDDRCTCVENDLMWACAIFFYKHNKIPVSIVEFMLRDIDNSLPRYKNNIRNLLMERLEPIYGVLSGKSHMGYPYANMNRSFFLDNFRNSFVETVLSFVYKYSWVDVIFNPCRLWAHDVAYCPELMDKETLYSYVYSISPEVEFSERLMKSLQSMIGDGTVPIDMKRDIANRLLKCTSMNYNTARFLSPFKNTELREVVEDANRMIIKGTVVNNTHGAIPLEDFRYLPMVLPVNNDLVQKNFILLGGDPDTLALWDKNSFVFTVDGVMCVLDNCKDEYIDKLLNYRSICEIIGEEVVGKLPYCKPIQTLVRVLSKRLDKCARSGELPNVPGNLYIRIKKFYHTIDMRELDVYLLRLERPNFLDSLRIVQKFPDAIYDIPITSQNNTNLLEAVRSNEKYIPINLMTSGGLIGSGMNKYMGRGDLYLLLDENFAYVADIEKLSRDTFEQMVDLFWHK